MIARLTIPASCSRIRTCRQHVIESWWCGPCRRACENTTAGPRKQSRGTGALTPTVSARATGNVTVAAEVFRLPDREGLFTQQVKSLSEAERKE